MGCGYDDVVGLFEHVFEMHVGVAFDVLLIPVGLAGDDFVARFFKLLRDDQRGALAGVVNIGLVSKAEDAYGDWYVSETVLYVL